MMESNTNDFTVAYQFYVSAKSEGNDDLLNMAREQILSSLSMFFNAKVKQYCETHSCVDYNTREEMKQSARIYALGKLDSYDVTRNVKFSTYINKGLERCIAKAAMSFNETVDIPDRILRVHLIIRDTIDQIQREGVEVTEGLLIKRLPDTIADSYHFYQDVFTGERSVSTAEYKEICTRLYLDKKKVVENYMRYKNIPIHKKSTSDPISSSMQNTGAELTIEDTISDTRPNPEEVSISNQAKEEFLAFIDAIKNPEDRRLARRAVNVIDERPDLSPEESFALIGSIYGLSAGETRAKLQQIFAKIKKL